MNKLGDAGGSKDGGKATMQEPIFESLPVDRPSKEGRFFFVLPISLLSVNNTGEGGMLHRSLQTVCSELGIIMPEIDKQKLYVMKIGGERIALQDLAPGFSLQADVCGCPKGRREELFIHLMQANLLGQGTGGARIGLDAEEKSLTLSFGMPYEVSDRVFREALEFFVNYLKYWRDVIAKFENEESVL